MSEAPPVRVCKTCQVEFPLHKAFFVARPKPKKGFDLNCRLCNSKRVQKLPIISINYMWANYRAPEGARVCMKCCEAKPPTADNFYRTNKTATGLMRQCKPCFKEARSRDPVREQIAPQGATKVCSGCSKGLPATDEYFHRHPRGKYGLNSKCKPCSVANRDRNKTLAYLKDWYAKNAEEVRARQRRKNAEDIASFRARRATQTRNRRARILGNGGTHTLEDVKRIHDGQKGRCWWCSKLVKGKYEVDHRIPVAKGGTNGPDNLVISCSACNRSKGARMPWEMDVPRLF